MRYLMLIFVCVLLVASTVGCSSSPDMQTRTYRLPQGDTSWEAITMVLEEEWQQHSTMSHAKRRDDGVAVRTTDRGHRKITEALKLR